MSHRYSVEIDVEEGGTARMLQTRVNAEDTAGARARAIERLFGKGAEFIPDAASARPPTEGMGGLLTYEKTGTITRPAKSLTRTAAYGRTEIAATIRAWRP